jgi:uncharacterized protein
MSQPRVPERGTALVVDGANVISADKEHLLGDALIGFAQTQQRRVAVVTVPDLQGYDIADYGDLLARRWGLHDGSNDDGAVLIVAPNQLKVRIEVGSRVREALPDAVARDIVETWVLPSFRQGDMDKGILDGAGAILSHLELPPEQAAAIAEQARREQAQAQEPDGFPWSGLAVLILLVVIWSMVRGVFGRLGTAVGAITLLGGGSGGGGARFGGFGGGGGGFNGGGAGGRW